MVIWCTAPAPVPAADLRVEQVRHLIEGANHDCGFQHKDLAAFMGFGSFERIGMYYRQLRTHGLNLNLLLNAPPRWWLAFMVRVCALLKIPIEQVLIAFGVDIATEEERRRKDEAFERRLRRLEELAGVPAPVPDAPAEVDQSDETTTADRVGGGDGPRNAGAALAAPGDLLPLHMPLHASVAVRGRLDL